MGDKKKKFNLATFNQEQQQVDKVEVAKANMLNELKARKQPEVQAPVQQAPPQQALPQQPPPIQQNEVEPPEGTIAPQTDKVEKAPKGKRKNRDLNPNF